MKHELNASRHAHGLLAHALFAIDSAVTPICVDTCLNIYMNICMKRAQGRSM